MTLPTTMPDAAALALSFINAYLWGGVAWMFFCRAVRLGSDTRPLVILSVSASGTMAIAQAVSPFIPGWNTAPRLLDVLLGGALFLFLLAFVPSWEHGAPMAAKRRR